MSTAATERRQPLSVPPMLPEAGVKYACAPCIRGHRTSTCTHRDGSKGPLYPIRSKGRPPTQCDICRQKRKTTGRHVRCDCYGKLETTSARQLPPPAKRRRTQDDPPPSFHADADDVPDVSPRSSLSLSSLMNPCGCKSTRSCTCCRDKTSAAANLSPLCNPGKCAETCASPPSAPASENAPKKGSGGCCAGKAAQNGENRTAPSIELLLKAVDMSAEFEPPACGCGDNCRCARCLSKPSAHTEDCSTNAAPEGGKADDGASGCDDCAACDLGLERPSGIGAVDAWLDKDKSAAHPPSPQPVVADSILHLHGGMLTPQPTEAGANVRAELVLLHPSCAACLDVVRHKGVGVLSSANTAA